MPIFGNLFHFKFLAINLFIKHFKVFLVVFVYSVYHTILLLRDYLWNLVDLQQRFFMAYRSKWWLQLQEAINWGFVYSTSKMLFLCLRRLYWLKRATYIFVTQLVWLTYLCFTLMFLLFPKAFIDVLYLNKYYSFLRKLVAIF